MKVILVREGYGKYDIYIFVDPIYLIIFYFRS